MNLSPNFKRSEFEKSGPMPDDVVPVYAVLCNQILEHIRAKFGLPIKITSGYRSPSHNVSINGSKTSQHVATPSYCAADFQVVGGDLVVVFDWIRKESFLPFDQVILEYGRAVETDTDDCIHISWKVEPRRTAMVGATNNRAPYVRVEVA